LRHIFNTLYFFMLKYQKSKTKALSMGKKDEVTKTLTATSIKTKDNSDGKWKKVADKMRGTMSKETVEYLKKCSNEIRK